VETGGRPVPVAVVGHRLTADLPKRRAQRRAVQRLDLALLVDTQDDSEFGRDETEPYYRPELLGELRVLADLEALQRMPLQAVGAPIRRTLASLSPSTFAIVRVLQWVAFVGFSRVVLALTCCTFSSGIVGVAPGRGASFPRAASPPSRHHCRHRAGSSGVLPNSGAISFIARSGPNTAQSARARQRGPTGGAPSSAAQRLFVIPDLHWRSYAHPFVVSRL
jgi:hypothetical protein